MARSSCIYVVMPTARAVFPFVPVAAFTVKRELKAWLEKRPNREELRLFRVPDGFRLGVVEIKIQDVLNGH